MTDYSFPSFLFPYSCNMFNSPHTKRRCLGKRIEVHLGELRNSSSSPIFLIILHTGSGSLTLSSLLSKHVTQKTAGFLLFFYHENATLWFYAFFWKLMSEYFARVTLRNHFYFLFTSISMSLRHIRYDF